MSQISISFGCYDTISLKLNHPGQTTFDTSLQELINDLHYLSRNVWCEHRTGVKNEYFGDAHQVYEN
jgi:hypothetical protein